VKRGYVDTPEGQIHYVTAGHGPPLLLLHQGPRSSRNYWKLLPLLAGRFRCIAPDMLGFGNSDPSRPQIRFEDFARNVTHVMDGLGIAKAHVFGLHTGNKVATALGAAFPDRVVRLVLCGMSHSLIVSQEARAKAIYSIVSDFKRFDASLREDEAMREWANAFNTIARIWWDGENLRRRDSGMDRFRHIEQELVDMLQARHGMYEMVPANMAYDLMADMRRLQAPTLVIEMCSAEEDALHGRQGPALMQIIAKGRLATLENCSSHSVVWDATRLAPLILEHLGNSTT
jgi:pimeloyl-ACP methyl ester carboxylesterase